MNKHSRRCSSNRITWESNRPPLISQPGMFPRIVRYSRIAVFPYRIIGRAISVCGNLQQSFVLHFHFRFIGLLHTVPSTIIGTSSCKHAANSLFARITHASFAASLLTVALCIMLKASREDSSAEFAARDSTGSCDWRASVPWKHIILQHLCIGHRLALARDGNPFSAH